MPVPTDSLFFQHRTHADVVNFTVVGDAAQAGLPDLCAAGLDVSRGMRSSLSGASPGAEVEG